MGRGRGRRSCRGSRGSPGSRGRRGSAPRELGYAIIFILNFCRVESHNLFWFLFWSRSNRHPQCPAREHCPDQLATSPPLLIRHRCRLISPFGSSSYKMYGASRLTWAYLEPPALIHNKIIKKTNLHLYTAWLINHLRALITVKKAPFFIYKGFILM